VSPRDWEFRIEDILDSIDLISEYVGELDLPSLKIKIQKMI
jgi:uncharacterized protein with HEPN domain